MLVKGSVVFLSSTWSWALLPSVSKTNALNNMVFPDNVVFSGMTLWSGRSIWRLRIWTEVSVVVPPGLEMVMGACVMVGASSTVARRAMLRGCCLARSPRQEILLRQGHQDTLVEVLTQLVLLHLTQARTR